MSNFVLATPREATLVMGRLFERSPRCVISVREDKAFTEDGWLNLGEVEVFSGDRSAAGIKHAIDRGAFEWDIPEELAIKTSIDALLGQNIKPSKLRRALDAIAYIAVRCGLRHPRFDARSVEQMPFRSSTTVVIDTSGALQGGLDFVARYLHPAARVKVPAMVQMEIVNHSLRFLENRRLEKTKPADLLIDHMLSQGGQRVLLRLELHSQIEIERTFLLGDPLRSAFDRDADQEIKDLHLSKPMKAYADRLILEAARHHQAQANIGHHVQLLTSDQGLARMALAEGMSPLFFNSVQAADIMGQKLSGALLNPFSGRLEQHSLCQLLWELATSFGCARLTSDDGQALTIAAFGEKLNWSPYQSVEDLLWMDEPAAKIGVEPNVKKVEKQIKDAFVRSSGVTKAGAGVQTFSAPSMIKLICFLDEHDTISDEQAANIVQVKRRSGLEEYRRFLVPMNALIVEKATWKANEGTKALAAALCGLDITKLTSLFEQSPSMSLMFNELRELTPGQGWIDLRFARGAKNYKTIAQICRQAAPVFGKGFFATSARPSVVEFSKIAVAGFQDLDKGQGWVSTGEWLERLIEIDGIHPELAREMLDEASTKNMLRRTTEGSTTDTRLDDHSMKVLRLKNGVPVIEDVYLYRGDYLLAGKASSSLRVEEQTT